MSSDFRNIVCGEPTILASFENLAVSVGRCELPFDRKDGWSHAVLQVAWCIQVAVPHPVWTYYYDVFMMQAVWCTRCSFAPGPGFHRFEVSPIFSNDLVLLECCFSHFLLFCIFQGEAACIFSRRGTFSISNSIARRYDTIWYNAPNKIWDWRKFNDSIDIQLVHCPWSL